ncbi:MAG: alpha-L-fucosidase [Lentisphaerota bacterium]
MKDEKNKSKWFREAGVGMFIHWGVYSAIGRGEWLMQLPCRIAGFSPTLLRHIP